MMPLDGPGLSPDRVAHQAGVAAAGREQAGEHGDGGAFAGSVGAKQAEDLALLNGEIQRLHGGEIAVMLVQSVELNGSSVFHALSFPDRLNAPILSTRRVICAHPIG